ncbi:MAG: type II secretion system F family protein [Candidatus Chaera renei]|uniref:Type II secretion system F family protein n=1 Tax=Candidatus Chaera renei TaxID=2506947 RepID=A0A4Q0AJK2_9BACT|nr:MAG: type II secretion system F family protein [Candidatus Chaera renei]
MPSYHYAAQDKSGQMVTGNVDASTRENALAALVKQDLKPIALNELRGQKFKLSLGGGKVRSKDLVIFTRQLSVMISAGVPLTRALTTLSAQSENPALKTVLEAITKDVQSGMTLGGAFAKHPGTFSDVFVNMVKAGEAGGILDDILKRLATQQEKNDNMRKKVKSAMTYPAVLLIITILSFFGLMFFVIPSIGNILRSLGGPDAQLPLLTRIMLGISGFMRNYWYLVIGGTAGLVFAVRSVLKTPGGKAKFHRTVIKLPGLGDIITKVAVARFARTFASLMSAGVSVLEALKVTGEAIGNVAFKDELAKAAEEVKNGKPLSDALSRSPLFPAIIPQMLAVGEETGQTDKVLVKVADFYEEEVDVTIDSISSIIEPVMLVIMGSMVGLIAASVMGPIASLSQNIKG